jgi:hypothetical protein
VFLLLRAVPFGSCFLLFLLCHKLMSLMFLLSK